MRNTEKSITNDFALANEGNFYFALLTYQVEDIKPRIRVACSLDSLINNMEYINPEWKWLYPDIFKEHPTR